MQNFDEQLNHLIEEALKEDVGDGDHTTLSCIPPENTGKAILKIKQDGILAGVEIARKIFSHVEEEIVFNAFKNDGEKMCNGEIAFEVEAHLHTILKCERLVLNCMQRMSGIATLTNRYAEKLNGYKTKLLDTRKTTPNFRLLEKEAVRIGGGVNHRFGLFDMLMLKDNHIDYCGNIERAIDKAWRYIRKTNPDLKIEVETRTMDEVRQVYEAGQRKVFRIMLDNFKPEQIKEALDLIKDDFETEASGGINLDNIESYAATGVDYISVGSLITQAQSIDLSLKAVNIN
jgi:nicotinate-nucleotide pyrophosphorylase (carboxylating)